MATILLSGIDDDMVERLRYLARGAELSPGQYVVRLMDLHENLRRHDGVQADSIRVADLLRRSGLGTSV